MIRFCLLYMPLYYGLKDDLVALVKNFLACIVVTCTAHIDSVFVLIQLAFLLHSWYQQCVMLRN